MPSLLSRRSPVGLWSRTYVCCAVPLYNAGIYAILSQFLVISIVTGVLCFAAPSIVSVTTPSFVSYILGILCILVALLQPIGFLGVYRERPKLFKTYSRINTLFVTLSILLALAIIIISAAQHSTGVDACTKLFSEDNSDTTADTICKVWTWVQVGIMGLLFVIVGLCQVYFMSYEAIYASEQKLDHARYDSVYSTAANEIRQSGLWDGQHGRPSYSGPYYSDADPSQQHVRQGSGLRNELPRGDTTEDLAYEAGEKKGGNKLKKSGLGRGAQGGNGYAADSVSGVSGYKDRGGEEQYEYGGGGGGYDYAGGREEAFVPPQQGSQMHQGQRW